MFFVKILVRVLLISCITFFDVSAVEKTRALSVGIAADRGFAHFAFEATELGNLNHATVYTKLNKPGLEYRKFPKGMGIVLVMKMPGVGSNLKEIANGLYDDDLRRFAQKVIKDGHPITLRVLPEFNGNWYPWGVYRKGNSHADFIPAWRHIVSTLRKETQLIKFDLNYNRKSMKGGTTDFKVLYPGDQWVDIVSVSTYNRCGLSKAHKESKSFAEEFQPAYDALVGLIGTEMPISIAETSTTSLCGTDKEEWFKKLFESLEQDFVRVTNITFFFVSKKIGTASNDVPIHWELETPYEVRSFYHLLREFRKRNNLRIPPTIKGVPIKPPEVKKSKTNKPDTGKSEHSAIKDGKKKHAIRDEWSVKMPWTLYGKLERVEGGFNPATNPVTKKPFGAPGVRFRFNIEQAIMWSKDFENGLMFGPRVSAKGTLSNNPNRWWDNAVGVAAGVQVCKRTKSENIDWGRICAFGQAEYKTYLVPVPDRLSAGEAQFTIGVQINMGGDWKK